MLWEHELQASISTPFSSSPNFHECFFNPIETWSTYFLFLVKKYCDEKENNLLT